jgi:mono/diheme cytochrome c family protein
MNLFTERGVVVVATLCLAIGCAKTMGPAPAAQASSASPVADSIASKQASAGATGERSASLPPGVTPQMVQQGHDLFNGTGRCVKCHGQDGQGTQKGPDLTGKHWLHIGGGYDEIVKIINDGVPEPKKFSAPMPPKGKANISDEQVHEIAGYVWTLSHP